MEKVNEPDAKASLKKVRGIGEWHFEDGGMLSMKIIGPTPTAEALGMAQTLIDLKRKELEASPVVLNTPATAGCIDAKADGSAGLTSTSVQASNASGSHPQPTERGNT